MTRRCHSLIPEDAKQVLATAEAKATSRGRASLSQRPAGRSRNARPMLRLALALMLALASQGVNAASSDKATSIVLVHGAFVDGSGWKPVYDLLSQDGYEVLVAQHTTSTLEGDAAAVASVIDSAKFPVVLVGHSYGGMVISEAGISPKVKSLVYVAAYAPEGGESVAKLAQLPAQPGESRAPLLPARDGHRIVDPAKFPAAFAADVPQSTTRFMAASQLPWGLAAVQAEVREVAWKIKPTAYLVTSKDRMIPPSVQRMMAKRSGARTIEVDSSHAVMLSRPREVAAFIESADVGAKSNP
jgi:pimeloyl-ACP methyl ester carboxylesterase